MNRSWMFPVGLFWGVIVLGLLGSGKPLTQLDLWLDNREAPVNAQANALGPVIDCMDRVDVQWRVEYLRYRTTGSSVASVQEWVDNEQDFHDYFAHNAQYLVSDICTATMGDKLRLLDSDPSLSQMTERYVQALQQVTRLTKQISFFLAQRYSSSMEIPQADFGVQFKSRADDYLNASNALRGRIDTLDLEQRRAQLDLIEARLGKDIHWYLLGYMIQARDTLDLISDGVKNRNLTPQTLARTTQALQQAWNGREPFRHPFSEEEAQRNKVANDLWNTIDEPTQKYLGALNTLHQDWQNNAAPQRLSDDYYAVTRGYDILLSDYNRVARMDY